MMQSKSNLTHFSENRDAELTSNGLLLFLTESEAISVLAIQEESQKCS